jgi:hypothetical protein
MKINYYYAVATWPTQVGRDLVMGRDFSASQKVNFGSHVKLARRVEMFCRYKTLENIRHLEKLYLSLKTEKSRRVTESHPVCVELWWDELRNWKGRLFLHIHNLRIHQYIR